MTQSDKKFALVTGCSRGLGIELAERLIELGYVVIGVSLTKKSWPAAKKRISAENFYLLEADVSREDKVKKLFTAVKKITPRIDLLVNSAAYGGRLQPIETESLKEFETHLRVNLISVFLMCRAALPLLKLGSKPVVMNISSMAGVRAVPRLAGYSASKFGVLAITEALAKENPDWLKAVTVCPGGMNTKMRSDLFGLEDAARQQTPAFVADIMIQVLLDRIALQSGSHIVVRHSKVTQIITPPTS